MPEGQSGLAKLQRLLAVNPDYEPLHKLTGNVWGFEFPVGQNLALVGFNQQNALFASTNLVQFWMLAKVDRFEIEEVIKFLHLPKLAKPQTTDLDPVP